MVFIDFFVTQGRSDASGLKISVKNNFLVFSLPFRCITCICKHNQLINLYFLQSLLNLVLLSKNCLLTCFLELCDCSFLQFSLGLFTFLLLTKRCRRKFELRFHSCSVEMMKSLQMSQVSSESWIEKEIAYSRQN